MEFRNHQLLTASIDDRFDVREEPTVATVLVTGAGGFLGGFLVYELLDRGYEVIGVDNESKYGTVVRTFDDNPNYRYVHGDAKDVELLRYLASSCDHLIANAALVGGVGYMHELPYDILSENDRIIASTCDAAIQARRYGSLRKVTYISSSMVYEMATEFPTEEGDEIALAAPCTTYGFQKLGVEYYARSAYMQYGLPYTIVRPFNCVGPGDRSAINRSSVPEGNLRIARGHVIPDLVERSMRREDPMPVLGDGSQIRCFIYAGDLARGVITAMEHSRAINDDFNIAGKSQIDVDTLAQLVWRHVNGDRPLRIMHVPPPPYDVHTRIPSIEKARDVLGFEANTTLDDMVSEVYRWFLSLQAGLE